MRRIFLKNKVKLIFSFFLFVLFAMVLAVNLVKDNKNMPIPVLNATHNNWDKKSFWFSPWGSTGVHKGIDIFAQQKTPVITPIGGIVVSTGFSQNGGNYIYILGSKLRVYYYAHLNTINVQRYEKVKALSYIGTVGKTGNAALKPYHLHFSVSSLLPIFKKYNANTTQGWKLMFYLNPNDLLIR